MPSSRVTVIVLWVLSIYSVSRKHPGHIGSWNTSRRSSSSVCDGQLGTRGRFANSINVGKSAAGTTRGANAGRSSECGEGTSGGYRLIHWDSFYLGGTRPLRETFKFRLQETSSKTGQERSLILLSGQIPFDYHVKRSFLSRESRI